MHLRRRKLRSLCKSSSRNDIVLIINKEMHTYFQLSDVKQKSKFLFRILYKRAVRLSYGRYRRVRLGSN
jgi:hypothetical protein